MQMVAFRIAPAGAPPAVPSAPSALSATGSSGTQINLAWTNTATSQCGVKIERSPDGVSYTQIGIAPTSATGYSDTNLSPGTSYTYRARATGGGGDSSYDGPVNATTAAVSSQSNFACPQTPQTSVSVPYASAQIAGDTNVVVVGWDDDTTTVSAVTDAQGNAYTLALGPTVLSGFATQAVYYAPNVAAAGAGANAVTVAFSAAAPFPDVRILEYSGLTPSSPIDGTAANSGISDDTTAGPLTTSHAHDLLVAANYIGSETIGRTPCADPVLEGQRRRSHDARA